MQRKKQIRKTIKTDWKPPIVPKGSRVALTKEELAVYNVAANQCRRPGGPPAGVALRLGKEAKRLGRENGFGFTEQKLASLSHKGLLTRQGDRWLVREVFVFEHPEAQLWIAKAGKMQTTGVFINGQPYTSQVVQRPTARSVSPAIPGQPLITLEISVPDISLDGIDPGQIAKKIADLESAVAKARREFEALLSPITETIERLTKARIWYAEQQAVLQEQFARTFCLSSQPAPVDQQPTVVKMPRGTNLAKASALVKILNQAHQQGSSVEVKVLADQMEVSRATIGRVIAFAHQQKLLPDWYIPIYQVNQRKGHRR